MPHSWTVDSAALAALVGVIWGAIPTAVALLAGIYYCLLIHQWFKSRRVSHVHAPETDHDGS